jgi:flagellar FliL protein
MSAAAPAADAPKSGGKKKLIMMVAVASIVLGGGGVGALVMMKKKAADAAAAADGDGEAAPAHAEKKKSSSEKKEKPTFVPMDPFVVNLADHDSDRYAQIGITLEVGDEKVGEEIKAYLPAIRNNILLLLAHKSSADLQGGEGKEKLAKQIRREALKAMGEEVDEEDDDEEAPAADAPPPKKKKKKKKSVEDDAPIRSVQFSSFIIQ